MRAPTKLMAGALLHERYRIKRLIGVGGMSYVYLAQDERLMGKYWAIKESIPLAHDREHLIREAQWLIELRHPNLPLIVDFFSPDEDGHAYLVMEYIEGETIAEKLKRTPISFDETIAYSLQLCDALSYLHGCTPPIIYRDMKPSNVMLAEQHRIKLIDFGIARQVKPSELADTMKLGTVGFAAPEQHEGKQSDARTDLYGIGALLAYVLTEGRWRGMEPFRTQMLNEDVPKSFYGILTKLMEVNPNARYQSADELKRALIVHANSEVLPAAYEFMDKGQRNQHGNANNGLQRAVTIAVTGIASGLGCTHMSLMIAHRLARSNRGKVAYVSNAESNRSVVHSILSSVEGNCAEDWNNKVWQWQGVSYIELGEHSRGLTTSSVTQLQMEYDFIIMDLGVIGAKRRLDEEFVRASYSLLIGSTAPWRDDDIKAALNNLLELNYQQWIFALPHAKEEELRSPRLQMKCHSIISVPTCSNPFKGTADIEEWMQSWMKVHEQKRKWFSWRKRK
ncbi:serine/threonine-protein kinase [Paenibacillus agilis]|uniref:Serine/threonine protein kinase n=1 Tax=Paenibacillus agilis TaxID=3020863 RepID=A0A559IZP2_9BACL|nr:serine/threonine-protein kinase [Paenibacillus agilis]TVX93098.1 serine/threonine protein kinase [Paenibacillus agilis]